MKNPVLIFDFDGTIADTFAAIVQISNQLADQFHYRKVTPLEAESLKNNSLKETIRQLNIPLLKIPLIVTRAKTALFKDISKISPVAGLKEILWELKNQNTLMGILTSNSAQNVKHFLENHGLNIFDFINSSSKIWSKDLILKKMIAQYQLMADNVIYIGDEARDIEAARRIGLKTAAVTWGYNSRQALEKHHPEFIFTRPSQLLTLIH